MAVGQRDAIYQNIKGLHIPAILRWCLISLGLIGLVWLALYNLPYNPRPWFDEGEHLRVPKTLVEYGKYAVWSAAGFRYFGPTIGVGPTVLLPIALVFQIFGVGLVQGRAVILVYLGVVLALYWLYSLKLWKSALFSTFALAFLCAVPGIELITLGRQVLGEVPALAFFLGGLLAWWRAGSKDTPQWGWIAAAGSLWALAAITKSTYGLLLPPILVTLWLANKFYYKVVGWDWRAFALPAVMVVGGLGGWYFIILLFLGGGNFSSNLELLRQASGGSAFVFSLNRMQSALKFVVGPEGLWGLAIPGLIYGIWLGRERTAGNLRLAMPLLFCLGWLGWFCFASVAWPRYAFPAMVVSSMFAAKLIWDAPKLLLKALHRPEWRVGLQVIVGLLVAALLVFGYATQVKETVKVDDGAQRLAAYLNQNVSKTALVETWESEMGFLTEHSYHYPSAEMLDKAVRRYWLNNSIAPLAEIYKPESLKPDYLINGPFSSWNNLYPASLLAEHYKLVGTFGDYTLYQRV